MGGFFGGILSSGFGLGKATGPIFGKELRVSSRRRRNYVLRSVYLALLTIFVALIWLEATKYYSYGYGSAAYRISRMSEAGKIIITSVTWFQFCALQLIAVIMLSTSVSDEIYHRTLGVLMTTPINSFQIVMGKLLSKLWQLIILLAISLPLLAIVRVFGGVPWEFVIAGLCITLSAVVFAGAVSMYFSIHSRRAYAVILKTLIAGGILYALGPFMVGWVMHEMLNFREIHVVAVLFTFNPIGMLYYETRVMMSPAWVLRTGPSLSWQVHCAIMLAGSALVLSRCVAVVRRVALRQATGEAGVFTTRRRRRAQKSQAGRPVGFEASPGRIRRIVGSPIIWKELRSPLLPGSRRRAVIGIIATIVVIFITYGICAAERDLDDDETHVAYVLIFLGLGILTTAVLSATSITTEKEARSWPILLATTLTDWQIILGKAVGIFRRCLPVWLLLAGHLVLFIFVGYIHPIVAVHLAMLVTWIIVFFTGAGLYFGSRFKRTTTAVVMNLALALVIWLILPGLLALIIKVADFHDYELLEWAGNANPVVQAVVVTDAASGRYSGAWGPARLHYDWPDGECDTAAETTSRMFAFTLGYILAGGVFAARARFRVRRSVF